VHSVGSAASSPRPLPPPLTLPLPLPLPLPPPIFVAITNLVKQRAHLFPNLHSRGSSPLFYCASLGHSTAPVKVNNHCTAHLRAFYHTYRNKCVLMAAQNSMSSKGGRWNYVSWRHNSELRRTRNPCLCTAAARNVQRIVICPAESRLLIVYIVAMACCVLLTSSSLMNFSQQRNFVRVPNKQCEKSFLYTGCPRRNVPDFGRMFLMLNYTDITQNTKVQSGTVAEIMAREVWNFDSCYSLIDYQIRIETGRNMWFL